MTDHEIEKQWNQIIEEKAPALWNRIEEGLDAREAVRESASAQAGRKAKKAAGNESSARERKAEKTETSGAWTRIKRFFFGGSSLRTAVALTCCFVLFVGLAGGMTGAGASALRMGSSGAAAAGERYSPSYGAAEDYASMELAEEAAYDGGAMEDAVNTSGGTGVSVDAQAQSGRKLIRDVDISAETMAFDELIESIKTQTSQAGGYLERSEVSGSSYSSSAYYRRSAYLVLRIPSGETDDFLDRLGSTANITSRSEGITDVTLQYVDMESHISALRAEEEQLLELMKSADSTETLITIQSELTQVRYQIESYQSQLNLFDNRIDYDTINLSISEVKQETLTGDPTMWERIRDGLARNVEDVITGTGDFLIWMITMIPYFIVFFLIILLIVSIAGKLHRRRAQKKKKD